MIRLIWSFHIHLRTNQFQWKFSICRISSEKQWVWYYVNHFMILQCLAALVNMIWGDCIVPGWCVVSVSTKPAFGKWCIDAFIEYKLNTGIKTKARAKNFWVQWKWPMRQINILFRSYTYMHFTWLKRWAKLSLNNAYWLRPLYNRFEINIVLLLRWPMPLWSKQSIWKLFHIKTTFISHRGHMHRYIVIARKDRRRTELLLGMCVDVNNNWKSVESICVRWYGDGRIPILRFYMSLCADWVVGVWQCTAPVPNTWFD